MKRINDLESKFRFVHVAARRTRQLQGGSQPHIHTTSRKAIRIAMEEILSGAVTYESSENPEPEKSEE